jgi:DNA-directed RNA polymerase alpha subunit
MQLQEIGLSLRARNALQRAGVGTVEALCDLATSDLAHMHGLGAGYIQEIPLALKRHGRA